MKNAAVVNNLSSVSAGDTREAGTIPGPGRSPGEAHGYPLQYSCLENPMDRGAWRATVQGVTESDTTEATRSCRRTPPASALPSAGNH